MDQRQLSVGYKILNATQVVRHVRRESLRSTSAVGVWQKHDQAIPTPESHWPNDLLARMIAAPRELVGRYLPNDDEQFCWGPLKYLIEVALSALLQSIPHDSSLIF